MQINRVGYNQGYSNQKVQKNNSQPSFGIIGGSLRAALVESAPAIRCLDALDTLHLQDSLGKLQASSLIAEYGKKMGFGFGVFLRNDKSVRTYGNLADIPALNTAAADAEKYARNLIVARAERDTFAVAQSAAEASATHDETMIDDLIAGRLTEETLKSVFGEGKKLETSKNATAATYEKALLAKSALENFFQTDKALTEAEVAAFEKFGK